MFFHTHLVEKLKIVCLLSNVNVGKSHQIEPIHIFQSLLGFFQNLFTGSPRLERLYRLSKVRA